MAEVTKPIMLDETGQALITKINELKNVLAPSGTLNITANGTYDVSEKGSVVVSVPSREGLPATVSISSTITMTEVTE